MKRVWIFLTILSVVFAAWLVESSGWLAASAAAMAASMAMMRLAVKATLSVSYRKRLFDRPGGRHIHTTPVPRLGGAAFAPVICCTVILGLAFHSLVSPAWHMDVPDCLTWISALVFIYMAGTIDDLVGVGYRVKFIVQILAACLVVASGFWIGNLLGIFGFYEISAWVGIPLTVLFVIAVINTFNLIDGMDGLAAGLAALALIVYGIHCFVSSRFFLSLAAFASLGAVIPFLWCNVRGVGRRRRKLFMGDTGSQTLGLVLVVLALGQIAGSGTIIVKCDMVLALSPLVVPLFDVVHVVVFRLLRGASPFEPDTTHIHHRLSRRGFSKKSAVTAILALAAGYIALDATLAGFMNITWILVIDVLIWVGFNLIINRIKR